MVPELTTDETHSLPLPQQQHHDENCNDDNDQSPHRHVSVVLLCGLPGSGKTTNAKHVCSHFVSPARRRQESKPPSLEATSLAKDYVSFDQVYNINYDDITNYLLLKQEQEGTTVDESRRSIELIDHLVKRSLVTIREQEKHNDNDDLDENDSNNENDNVIHCDDDTSSSLNNNETNYFSENHLIAWKFTRRYALEVLKQTILHQSQRQHVLIVMDDNFFLKSMRHHVIQTCRQMISLDEENAVGETKSINNKISVNHNDDNNDRRYDNTSSRSVSVSMVVFDTPLEECHRRNELRPSTSRIPRYILDKMSNRFEFPSFHDENNAKSHDDHNKNHTPVTNVSSNNVEQIPVIRIIPEMNTQQVFNAIANGILLSRPLSTTKNVDFHDELQKEQDRQATLNNRMHQMDNMLRQFVGVTSKYNKGLAKYANETRKIMLEQYRHDRDHNTKGTLITNDDDDDEENVMFFETLLLERYFHLLSERINETNYNHPASRSSSIIDLKQFKCHLQQTVLQQQQQL